MLSMNIRENVTSHTIFKMMIVEQFEKKYNFHKWTFIHHTFMYLQLNAYFNVPSLNKPVTLTLQTKSQNPKMAANHDH